MTCLSVSRNGVVSSYGTSNPSCTNSMSCLRPTKFLYRERRTLGRYRPMLLLTTVAPDRCCVLRELNGICVGLMNIRYTPNWSLTFRRGKEKWGVDRKSTRLNSSHVKISYAVFCLKK